MRTWIVRNFLFASVLALLAALSACGEDTETITNRVETEVFPDCSATHPNGKCEAGQTCFEGACVVTDTLCSVFNRDGACPAGQTCFDGGCLAEALLCGATNPTGLCAAGEVCTAGVCGEPVEPVEWCGPANVDGPCPEGQGCFGGVCTALTDLCSTLNPTGACLIGHTCVGGACVPTAELCSGLAPDGACPGDLVCDGGLCVPPTVPPGDPCAVAVYETQPVLGTRTAVTQKPILVVDGLQFKDLDGDGALAPYEDWRLLEICRAEDLVSRMETAQKIGLMVSGSLARTITEDGTISDDDRANIVDNNARQGIIRTRGASSPQQLARFFNALQELAEGQPLGIPLLVVQDPSHSVGTNLWTNWPGTLGLGAIGDPQVTKQYGDCVREEYMAVGIRMQYGPMADLATEPRWRRVSGTFGENAHAVARHVAATVEGFQGSTTGDVHNGIVSTVKHFPGHGAERDGLDAHQREGRYIVFPGGYFEYHTIPFQAAFDVGAGGIMPCFGLYLGQTDWSPEQTAAAFSYGLITRLAKEHMGFRGLVTADWNTMIARPFGLESLPPAQRVGVFFEAGSHQFGLEPYEPIFDAYEEGWLDDETLDAATTKVLETFFELGLFENPYVDVDDVPNRVRTAELRGQGFVAQKKAIVLLKNMEHSVDRNGTAFLPIDGARYTDLDESGAPSVGEYDCDANGDGVVRVLYDGDEDGLAGSDVLDDFLDTYDYTSAGSGTALPIEAADTLADADIVVIRVDSPRSLDFDGSSDAEKVIDAFRARDGYTGADGVAVEATNPDLKIVLVESLGNPAIVKPFIDGLISLDETAGEPGSYPTIHDDNIRADGLGGVDAFVVDFGAFDRAVLDVLFNADVPENWSYGLARLPLEIPSSMAAVEAQFEDLPSDSVDPTYDIGAGMTY